MSLSFRLPSDCTGTGYDIADKSHPDDLPTGLVHLGDGTPILRTKLYANGLFAGYQERQIKPDLEKHLMEGVRYEVSEGSLPRSQGSGPYWTWHRVQVEARDLEDGRRRLLPNGRFVIPLGDYRRDLDGISGPEHEKRQKLRDTAQAFADQLNNA